MCENLKEELKELNSYAQDLEEELEEANERIRELERELEDKHFQGNEYRRFLRDVIEDRYLHDSKIYATLEILLNKIEFVEHYGYSN